MITQTQSPSINDPTTSQNKDRENNKQQLIINEANHNNQSNNNDQIEGQYNETTTQRDQNQNNQQIKLRQNKLEFVDGFATIIEKIYDKNVNVAEQFNANFIKTSQYQLQNIIKSNNSSQISQKNYMPSPSIPLAAATKLKVDVQKKKRRTFVLKDIQFDKTKLSDRALQLSYRMAKERLNRQKQYTNKNINTATKPINQLLPSSNKSRLASINPIAKTGTTLINPLKIPNLPNREEFNEFGEFSDNFFSQTNKIQQNYINKQIDVVDLYKNELNTRRRTLNIGKIVKRNNITPVNFSKSIENTSRTIDIYSLRPPSNLSNIPYNINNIQTDWNDSALINPNSLKFRRKLQKQQQLRQLKILELSQRKNEKYHIRKFIISFLIEISDEAVQRIQQKRTFFSYRIHRYNKTPIPLMLSTELKERSLQKSQVKKDLQNSQIGLGKSMIKLAESIHPKHERAKQNTLNIHSIKQILNKSRMNKEQVDGFMYEDESNNKDEKTVGKINKSRIQNVFAYTIEGKQQQQSNQNSNQKSSSNQNQSKSSDQESQSKDNTSSHESDSNDKDQESSDQSQSQSQSQDKSKNESESDSSTSQEDSLQNTNKSEQKEEKSEKIEQNQSQIKKKLEEQSQQKIQSKQDRRYPQMMNGSLQQNKVSKSKIPKPSLNNLKYKTNKNLQKKTTTLNQGSNMNKKSLKK